MAYGYTVLARTNSDSKYLDDYYKDPRGAANAAIQQFDRHPDTVSCIITRVSVLVESKPTVKVSV